jgi:hypothetical protein
MSNKEPFCLIGHTGFVGSTLQQQFGFTHQYNRSNIKDIIAAPHFELAVCAAAPGSMFEANRQPEEDMARIASLMEHLRSLHARHFVLISSIAVLADFQYGADETSTRFETELAYGRNRRVLERFCAERFSSCLIVRLPALFGNGLRKNFIFDLLNPVPSLLGKERLNKVKNGLTPNLFNRLTSFYSLDTTTEMLKLDRTSLNAAADRFAIEDAVNEVGLSAVHFHNPATTYQYYDMSRLWADISIASGAGLHEIHFATEPLVTSHIYQRLMGRRMPDSHAKLHHEDMHTRYARLWGRCGPYVEDADSVLGRLKAFFVFERGHS